MVLPSGVRGDPQVIQDDALSEFSVMQAGQRLDILVTSVQILQSWSRLKKPGFLTNLLATTKYFPKKPGFWVAMRKSFFKCSQIESELCQRQSHPLNLKSQGQ